MCSRTSMLSDAEQSSSIYSMKFQNVFFYQRDSVQIYVLS